MKGKQPVSQSALWQREGKLVPDKPVNNADTMNGT